MKTHLRMIQQDALEIVNGWYALFVCEMAKPEPLSVSGAAVVVDVGISSFTILSNGEEL
jgi:hypothetical protein